MKHESRFRWKLPIALVSVLVGVAVICLLAGQRPQRKEFLGSVDPVSGYRCRFTLSPVWKWKVTMGLTGKRQGYPPSFGNHGEFIRGESSVDEAQFTFPPRPASDPLSQWLSLHFFPKAVPEESPKIGLFSCPLKDFPAHLRLVQGYPDPEWEGTEPKHTQSHLLIDGCPATVIYGATVDDSRTSLPNRPGQYAHLLVYKPDSGLLYNVSGVAEESSSAWLHREMEAIITSFHVEKAPVPKGKR